MRNAAIAFGLVALAAFAGACAGSSDGVTWVDGPGPNAGGQSGTDQPSNPCPVSEQSVAFEDTTALNFSGRDLLAALERATAPYPPVVLHWELQDLSGDTELELEPVDHPSSVTFIESVQQGCSAVSFDLSLRARTRDGQLEVVFAGPLVGSLASFQFIGRHDLRERADGARVLPDEVEAAAQDGSLVELGMRVDGAVADRSIPRVELSGILVDANGTSAELATFERDDEPREREHHVYAPPAEFAALCAQAQATTPLATSDPAAVAAAIRGPWVLCSGERSRPIDHAGIELTEGRWNHLSASGGVLSEQLGFGHEGTLDVANVGFDPSGRLELLMHGSEPLSTMIRAPELSADGRTLRMLKDEPVQLATDYYEIYREDLVYVRSSDPVAVAMPARARGERAGTAACSEGEAFVRDRYGSVDELRAAIEGAWTLCEGTLAPDATGIAFAADGGYRYLGDDGSELGGGRYTISEHTANQTWVLINPALAGPPYSIELYDDGNPGPPSVPAAEPAPPPAPNGEPRAVPAAAVPMPDHWFVVPLASEAPRKLLLASPLPADALYPGFTAYPLRRAVLSALPQ